MKAHFLPALLVLVAALGAAPSAEGAERRRAVGHPAAWHLPQCALTAGTGGVALSLDGGSTVLPSPSLPLEASFTYGLAALESPNRMLAIRNGMLLVSTDAGCNWTEAGELEGAPFPPFLTPTRGDVAWAWTGNYDGLWRIEGLTAVRKKSPVESIAGFTFDPEDPTSLRIAGADGSFWRSDDDGESWEWTSSLKLEVPILYRVSWSPEDPDHAVAGTATTGAMVTMDGGATWTAVEGLSKTRGPVNAMNVVFSPADPSVVWLMAIDLDASDAGEASGGRHIYRSTDGGRTFTPVVDRSAEVTITNGPVMAPHPTDPDRLYFVFGSYFQQYGTDLFDYDAGSGLLRIHHHPFDDIDSIAFSPLDPEVMYLGLERSRPAGAKP